MVSPEPVKRANLCCSLSVKGCFTQLLFLSAEKHENVFGAAAIDNVKLFMWFVDLCAILIIYEVQIVFSVELCCQVIKNHLVHLYVFVAVVCLWRTCK